jgi:ubiquinone/menaquinone biosynthesis C-methylase UbiE
MHHSYVSDTTRKASASLDQFGSPDYVEKNRQAWEQIALGYGPLARKTWSADQLRWGLWRLPETELELLRFLPHGSDVVELGCGTAAISAWLTRHEMRPVAIDFVGRHLERAEQLQREFGLSFPLVHANAESVPFDKQSFDMAVSEYGASLWCEPRRWLAEAYRVLRPGGVLVFITNSPLLMACTPSDGSLPSDRLVHDYFQRHRHEFPEGTVEFHARHGEWIGLLRATGFTLENLVEVRPHTDLTPLFPLVTGAWAHRWPSEDIWIARKID